MHLISNPAVWLVGVLIGFLAHWLLRSVIALSMGGAKRGYSGVVAANSLSALFLVLVISAIMPDAYSEPDWVYASGWMLPPAFVVFIIDLLRARRWGREGK